MPYSRTTQRTSSVIYFKKDLEMKQQNIAIKVLINKGDKL